MDKYFRRKDAFGAIHKVPKRRNGKPWRYTVCMWDADGYKPTRDATTCELCLNPKPKLYNFSGIDPATEYALEVYGSP